VQITKAQSEAHSQFPVLMNGPASLLWVLSPGAEHASFGLTLSSNSSVRVEVLNPDWNAFEAIELEATLDSAIPQKLGIRLARHQSSSCALAGKRPFISREAACAVSRRGRSRGPFEAEEDPIASCSQELACFSFCRWVVSCQSGCHLSTLSLS
jgi:hypothetical protein